jgi:hypothetical protein
MNTPTELHKRSTAILSSGFSEAQKRSLFQRLNDKGFWQFLTAMI